MCVRELTYLSGQCRPHPFIQRATCHEIVHVHRVLLADTMSSVFTLLQGTRGPVQLSKHHQASCGQCQALKNTDEDTWKYLEIP